MLRFVLGRAGSGKTEYLRRMLGEESLSRKEGLFMLVPEQYTFETEKAMLALCGPQRANSVKVYSFTRLADAVFRAEGGAAGKRLSDGGRRILMSSAISECEDQLEVYKNAAKSGRVTDIILTAVNEMKLCGISPEQLSEAANNTHNRGLSQKLTELSLLYSTFEAMVAASYLDSRDDLTRLAEKLETSEYFRNAVVAVDSFEGFTAQESGVLRKIMQKAESVTVSLCTDGLDDSGLGLFALVDRTRRRLTAAAREDGVEVEAPVVLTSSPRYKNENLKLVEAQLFCAEETLTSPDCDGITVFEAQDVYEESEFVASAIRRLVMEKGWRYRDFSVICRSPEKYYGSLDVALKKRGVPCFVSEPAKVDAEPVMRFVLGAFEVIRSGYNTDEILEMLKTGISGFTAEEISELENYIYLWKINRGDWQKDFFRHPRGFGEETTDEDIEALARLNSTRERITRPLARFASSTKDASGAEISQAVFDLLQDFNIEENLPAYCKALEEAGDDSLAAKQIRVWDLLTELLDQLYNILGDKKTSRERYGFLLKEVVSAEDISEIPQTVDQVIFGTAEQVRQSSPKAAFLIGASQGDFPLIPGSSGVFSDSERRELISMELPLGDPLEQKTIEERYLAYSVACAPSEMLFVSWAKNAGGEEKEKSEIVTGLMSVFPTLKITSELPDEFFANSMEASFSRMAARFNENTAEAETLKLLFKDDPDYAGRVAALERASGQRPDRIVSRELTKKLFGENPFLSPSQIESYHSCPFKYFCTYGLKAKERRTAEIDVLQYGTLMHYLFENVFSAEKTERTDEELTEYVRSLISDYAEKSMGGFDLLGSREKYRLERLTQSAVKLIRHVEEELAQSRFTPKYFELKLGTELPPLKIDDGEGGKVFVGGTIDRADVVTLDDGRNYVRVIDYKTGHKVFSLADVLYGLNMQMLVYLAALTESGAQKPAGILYMPSAEPAVNAERGDDDEKIKSEAEKQLAMKGLILSDEEIIRAMEAGAEGKFVPATFNQDGSLSKKSSVVNAQELDMVLDYSKRLIATMGRELKQGIVGAQPSMKRKNDCKYCPYSAVCGKEYNDKDVEQEKIKNDEALERMAEVTKNG